VLIGRAAFVRLCRARELIVAVDGGDGRSVHTIAAQFGMSSSQLIRQFRALFGQTPHQLRIEARIARAQQLLALGHAVTDVCMAVGCSSLGSFSSAFLRRVGTTPSAFQRARRVYQVPGHDCFAALALLPRAAFAIFEKHRTPDLGTLRA
jgi:AraC-like DNA-binding protein